MMNTHKHSLILEITQNALLSLYLMISNEKRFVTTEKRNAYLVQYLKKIEKKAYFKNIKKEIKLMILVAKKKASDLEIKLIELNRSALAEQNSLDDAQILYDFLQSLLDNYGYDSKLYESVKEYDHDVIYIMQEQLVNCFSPKGAQLAPISIIISLMNIDKDVFIENLSSENKFQIELNQYNQTTKALHLLLHPIGQDIKLYHDIHAE